MICRNLIYLVLSVEKYIANSNISIIDGNHNWDLTFTKSEYLCKV